MMGHDAQVTAAFAVGLSSAAGFAMSNALQHQAAGRVPESIHRALGLLLHLARQRLWLVATAVSFGAMLLHAVALRLGSLALVQPLMLVGVVLAVPLRAALERRLPDAVGDPRRVLDGGGPGSVRRLSRTHAVGMRRHSIPGGAAMVGVCLDGGRGVLSAPPVALPRTPWARAVGQPCSGLGAGLMFGVAAGLLKVIGAHGRSGRRPRPASERSSRCLVVAGCSAWQ